LKKIELPTLVSNKALVDLLCLPKVMTTKQSHPFRSQLQARVFEISTLNRGVGNSKCTIKISFTKRSVVFDICLEHMSMQLKTTDDGLLKPLKAASQVFRYPTTWFEKESSRHVVNGGARKREPLFDFWLQMFMAISPTRTKFQQCYTGHDGVT
jgi:hypothetical protein